MTQDTKDRLQRVGMGFLMAGAGAAVVAGLQFLQGQDFGVYTPFVVAITGALINAARVYFMQPVPHANAQGHD